MKGIRHFSLYLTCSVNDAQPTVGFGQRFLDLTEKSMADLKVSLCDSFRSAATRSIIRSLRD
jgi:hypothetical protein